MYSRTKTLISFVLVFLFFFAEANRMVEKRITITKQGGKKHSDGSVTYDIANYTETATSITVKCVGSGPNGCAASSNGGGGGGGNGSGDTRLDYIDQIEAMIVANGLPNGMGDVPTLLGNLHFEYQNAGVDPEGIIYYADLVLFDFN